MSEKLFSFESRDSDAIFNSMILFVIVPLNIFWLPNGARYWWVYVVSILLGAVCASGLSASVCIENAKVEIVKKWFF